GAGGLGGGAAPRGARPARRPPPGPPLPTARGGPPLPPPPPLRPAPLRARRLPGRPRTRARGHEAALQSAALPQVAGGAAVSLPLAPRRGAGGATPGRKPGSALHLGRERRGEAREPQSR